MNKENISVYEDTSGDFFDKYTVIFEKEGEVFGMSANACAPDGFNQYMGTTHDLPLVRAGTLLKWEAVPEEVKRAISARFGAMNE